MDKKDENKREELEEKIRELEDKIRRMEEKGEVPEGTAASILEGLVPGLSGLVKGLEMSEAFQERLGAIDKEIEVRLRSQPLKRTESGVPSFQSGASRGTILGSIPHTKRQTAAQVKREVVASKEPPVDVFDEETHLRVLAELPGVEKKDIKIVLSGTELVISTDTPSHKYYKEITLPYAPKGQVEKSYRNGVLELTLSKE